MTEETRPQAADQTDGAGSPESASATSESLANRSPDKPPPGGLWAAVKETAIVVVVAMALSLFVKTFLFQAFYIPSGSMETTLQLEDRVMVSKLTPGPFDLHRGDIIVFTDFNDWLSPDQKVKRSGDPFSKALRTVGLMPNDSNDHLIKRIIGMPGDRVTCCAEDGRLTVNGVPIDEPYVYAGNQPSMTEFDITVPAGRVWVMGDHRSDSGDSRAHDEGSGGKVGSVPIDKVTGKAFALVWPLSHATWLGRPEETFRRVDALRGPQPPAAPVVAARPGS